MTECLGCVYRSPQPDNRTLFELRLNFYLALGSALKIDFTVLTSSFTCSKSFTWTSTTCLFKVVQTTWIEMLFINIAVVYRVADAYRKWRIMAAESQVVIHNISSSHQFVTLYRRRYVASTRTNELRDSESEYTMSFVWLESLRIARSLP